MNRGSLTASLLLTAAASIAAAGAAPKQAAGARYDVKGQYYETCACAVSCPCASKLKPTGPHCDAVMVFHIERGKVAATSLDGLNIVGVLRSPKDAVVAEAMEKGELDLLAFYLDDKATPQQREALGRVMPALFGESQPKGARPAQFAPMTLGVQGDVAKLEVGSGKIAFEIENLSVGEDTKLAAKGKPGGKKRVALTNTAPFPFVNGALTQGRSKSFDYNDFDTQWHYDGRNAFFSTFASSGSLK